MRPTHGGAAHGEEGVDRNLLVRRGLRVPRAVPRLVPHLICAPESGPADPGKAVDGNGTAMLDPTSPANPRIFFNHFAVLDGEAAVTL